MPEVIIDFRPSPPPPYGQPPQPSQPPAPLVVEQPPQPPTPSLVAAQPPPPPAGAQPPPVLLEARPLPPHKFPPPPPPPPPTGASNYLGANVQLTLTFNIPFHDIVDRLEQFASDLTAELATTSGLPLSAVRATSITAGSVVAKMTLFFSATTHTYNDAAVYALAVQQDLSTLTSEAFQQLYAPVDSCISELTAKFKEMPAPPPPPAQPAKQQLSGGGIAGLVFGLLIAVGLAALGGTCYFRQQHHRRSIGRPRATGDAWWHASWWLGPGYTWRDALLPWRWTEVARQKRYQQQESLRVQDELRHSKIVTRMPRLVQGSLAGVRESLAGTKGSLAGGKSGSGGGSSSGGSRQKGLSSRREQGDYSSGGGGRHEGQLQPVEEHGRFPTHRSRRRQQQGIHEGFYDPAYYQPQQRQEEWHRQSSHHAAQEHYEPGYSGEELMYEQQQQQQQQQQSQEFGMSDPTYETGKQGRSGRSARQSRQLSQGVVSEGGGRRPARSAAAAGRDEEGGYCSAEVEGTHTCEEAEPQRYPAGRQHSREAAAEQQQEYDDDESDDEDKFYATPRWTSWLAPKPKPQQQQQQQQQQHTQSQHHLQQTSNRAVQGQQSQRQSPVRQPAQRPHSAGTGHRTSRPAAAAGGGRVDPWDAAWWPEEAAAATQRASPSRARSAAGLWEEQ